MLSIVFNWAGSGPWIRPREFADCLDGNLSCLQGPHNLSVEPSQILLRDLDCQFTAAFDSRKSFLWFPL